MIIGWRASPGNVCVQIKQFLITGHILQIYQNYSIIIGTWYPNSDQCFGYIEAWTGLTDLKNKCLCFISTDLLHLHVVLTIQLYLHDSDVFPEGEQEAEWLRLAGLSQLTGPYEQGRELPDSELDPALRFLPTHHAEAVRRRVKTLNLTVRQRGRQQRSRTRKPDIRDVFRDVEVRTERFYVFLKQNA